MSKTIRAVVYDFNESRAGKHAREFLGDWQGKLVCDDFAGYKASFEDGVTELGCMAHARRKFFDLYESNGSETAAQSLEYIKYLYEIEREAKELPPDKRREKIKQSQCEICPEQNIRRDAFAQLRPDINKIVESTDGSQHTSL